MRHIVCFALFLAASFVSSIAWAQQLDVGRVFEEKNLEPVRELLAKGEYDLCERSCKSAISQGAKLPEWRLLRLRALLALGQEDVARNEAEEAVKAYPGHLELLMALHEIAVRLGRRDIANEALKAVNEAAPKKPARERTAGEWVALGQAALALGADAKQVVDQYFSVAQKKDPKYEGGYLAEGRLSLTKDDPKRAAEVFRAGLKAHGESADLRAGLARAFDSSDREMEAQNISRALDLNPVHAEALLARAELLIGAEKFLEAEAAIQKVLDVRDNCPEAWALRAAVMHLNGADQAKSESARAKGLSRWNRNPAVDHIFGRVLSRAYRFAEGAARQRQALEFDSGYQPAMVQLCHDLLRLGHEDEAWKLAAAVRSQDRYNVQAHNIGLLEEEMRGYTTQVFDDFILKMPAKEWPIYGERALALLREAKSIQCTKYGLELKHPVLVEFFGAQQDFAIRTFGSLGGQGLLGVCFGTVITMNSPGSLAHGRNNWEATLWHEFCHVVTLNVTGNRMPRWFSEGISVYEEGQRNPLWGMAMNAQFRKMIVDEKAVTPIGQLTSAFLNAQSEEHLMFAYFESSQVVAYLLERFGRLKFQSILKDLADGKRINEAIASNTEPMDSLEKDFTAHLLSQAMALGANADWKEPTPQEVNPLDPASFAAYLKANPANLWALRRQAAAMMEDEKWEDAIQAANALILAVPGDVEEESGYRIKAAALRKLGRVDEETALLRLIAERDAGALPVFLRLLELDMPRKDWPLVGAVAESAIALNPFLRIPQQAAAQAAEAQGRPDAAIAAYQRVLLLDPGDAAMTHFRLANLLKDKDAVAAKHHLLDSLALAPRFREGHEMLRSWK